jgi:hypothetical protein
MQVAGDLLRAVMAPDDAPAVSQIPPDVANCSGTAELSCAITSTDLRTAALSTTSSVIRLPDPCALCVTSCPAPAPAPAQLLRSHSEDERNSRERENRSLVAVTRAS